jgi:hypothetical protein
VPKYDRQAVDILLRTYWTAAGWRPTPLTGPEDLSFAEQAGVMFHSPWRATHDEVVRAVVEAAEQLTACEVADAFLGSLSTRRLELRSALGSFAVARHLRAHAFEQSPSQVDHRCGVCGLYDGISIVDRNILNFERYKWGGVRRDDLTYVAFDLWQFLVVQERQPATKDDRDLFRGLLDDLVQMSPSSSASVAGKAGLRRLPGSVSEREVLLDILGVCGILETAGHRGYSDQFIPARDRILPSRHYVDRTYPVCWWKSSDGVNRQAIAACCLDGKS